MGANRRIALLIATDTYADDEFTDLRTPCADATALASLLEDPSIGAFEVTTLRNRPVQDVRQALDETFTDTHRDDLVLLHVSGHGIKDEAGRLHLVMTDTRRSRLRSGAIAATWVRELIDHCHARRIVVWLDCCFSGAFPSGFTPKGVETVDAIDQLSSGSGRGCAVMTASTKIQYAFEQGQASVFTAAIIDGLSTGGADLNGDGFVDVSELYSYVFDWVRARTHDQTPTRNDMLTGDIFIAQRPDLQQRNTSITAPPSPTSGSPQVVSVPRDATTFTLIRRTKAFSTFWRLAKQPYVTGMAFDPSEPHRVCVSGNNILDYVDVETGDRVDGPLRRASGKRLQAIAFSPDGRLLAMATETSTAVWATDPPSLAIGSASTARAVSFSLDGSVFATVDFDVRLWDVRSHEKIGKITTGNRGSSRALAFSPDGRLLATGGDGHDCVVQLWDPRERKLVGELRGHDAGVRAVKFSPDGQMLATAGFDCSVRLWDVSSRRLVRKLAGHRLSVTSLAFSPDGRLLVSGGLDRAVQVWDLDNRERLLLMSDLPDAVVAVDFNPAGDRLACACAYGHVLVWSRD